MQTVLDNNGFRNWTREVSSTPGGASTEIIKDQLGRQRFMLANDESGWKITETSYAVRQGKETPWRAMVKEYSSDGRQTTWAYNNGRTMGSQTQPLELIRTA